MKPIWRQKWQDLGRKRVQSGLFARSSAVTLRGTAILPSFGFGRFDHLPRRERLENEPHFLRFRFSQLVKTTQTKLTSFMSPYPRQKRRPALFPFLVGLACQTGSFFLGKLVLASGSVFWKRPVPKRHLVLNLG